MAGEADTPKVVEARDFRQLNAHVKSPNAVTLAQIADTSTLVGNGFSFEGAPLERGSDALAGSFTMIRLRPGLVVHTSDATELHDITTHVEQMPGLTIHFFLDGAADARLGGQALELGRRPGRPVEGVITARAEPDGFERRAHKGDHVRKVNVTLSSAWLEESAFGAADEFDIVRDFAVSHRARFSWTPDATVVRIAEQMLRPPAYSSIAQNLYLESRALDLVGEALAALTGHASGEPLLRLRSLDRRRLAMIEDYLDDHAGEIASLDELARVGGVSVSTLRRLFQAAYGTTVFERLRRRGLERARLALEREGVTVAEAAFRAGYSSPANFATAFKRRFGITPTEIRRH